MNLKVCDMFYVDILFFLCSSNTFIKKCLQRVVGAWNVGTLKQNSASRIINYTLLSMVSYF